MNILPAAAMGTGRIRGNHVRPDPPHGTGGSNPRNSLSSSRHSGISKALTSKLQYSLNELQHDRCEIQNRH
jgi:hypothetical protein